MMMLKSHFRRNRGLLMCHIALFSFQFNLYKIKAKEYEYPNKIHKVPVQSGFLYHQVMTSSVKHTSCGHDKHYYINDNTRKNVETMEAGDAKEITTKSYRSFFANMCMLQVYHPS